MSPDFAYTLYPRFVLGMFRASHSVREDWEMVVWMVYVLHCYRDLGTVAWMC